MTVTIKYGLESVTKTYPSVTIGSLKADANLKAVLGFGDNVKALINGVDMTGDVLVPDHAVVVLETACNSKAV